MITMIKGFRDFLLKGDLITAAVGLVMALATFTLTETLVDSLITPIIGAIVGEPNFVSSPSRSTTANSATAPSSTR